jgi:hypothetical protein
MVHISCSIAISQGQNHVRTFGVGLCATIVLDGSVENFGAAVYHVFVLDGVFIFPEKVRLCQSAL